jgi:hypothetical protein
MAYKPGDYYIQPSGMVMQWDGSAWKSRGQSLAPGGQQAINNGRLVNSKGAQINPVVKQEQNNAASNATGGAAPEPPKQFNYELTGPSKDTDYLGKGSLRYPSDPGTFNASDYMIFEFFQYKPPFSAGQGGGLFSYAEYNKSITGLTAGTRGDKKLDQIILYMPEDISASYSAEWTGKKFSNIGAGLMQAAGNTANGDIGAALQNLASTAGGTVKRAPAQIGAAAVSAIVGGITGESISSNDIFSSIGGQIFNPNTELIFGGHDLRTFTFTYKLVAYNQAEAEIIKNIIYNFKIAMLPSFGDKQVAYDKVSTGGDIENSNVSGGIGFIKNPLLVQPYFMHGTSVHTYLPRFKPCTITNFDVNYTADGAYAVHSDGSPVAATITISLLETKLVYSEDIAKGF